MPQACKRFERSPRRQAQRKGFEVCLKIGDSWVTCTLSHLGHVGCCDSSEQHRHEHFHAVHHPIIQSFEPGEDGSRCYVDGTCSWNRGCSPRRRHDSSIPAASRHKMSVARASACRMEDQLATPSHVDPDTSAGPPRLQPARQSSVGSASLRQLTRPHQLRRFAFDPETRNRVRLSRPQLEIRTSSRTGFE